VAKLALPCCTHYFFTTNDFIGHSKPNAVNLNPTLLGLLAVLVSVILRTNHVKTEIYESFVKHTCFCASYAIGILAFSLSREF
jgi:hypothetical protein